MNQTIFNEVQNCFLENLSWVKKNEITKDAKLKDIGIDSIQMMILIVNCEDKFHISFGEDVLENDFFDTIESVVNYIDELTSGE